jgi:hypothetical protein
MKQNLTIAELKARADFSAELERARREVFRDCVPVR